MDYDCRLQLENQHIDKARSPSVWQLVADKCNDPLFLPVTAALPQVHSDFSRPIPLSFDSVHHMQPATAEKVRRGGSR
jgi:hypothetical protein